jgi:hypothetical protein
MGLLIEVDQGGISRKGIITWLRDGESGVESWQLDVESRRGEHFHFHQHLLYRHMSTTFLARLISSPIEALVSGPCIDQNRLVCVTCIYYAIYFVQHFTSSYQASEDGSLYLYAVLATNW